MRLAMLRSNQVSGCFSFALSLVTNMVLLSIMIISLLVAKVYRAQGTLVLPAW